MVLEDLGYNQTLDEYRLKEGLESFMLGRVSIEHRERYIIINEKGEFDAELLGNLRFSAQAKSELPVVGDWVAMSIYDENKALIHKVFPRYSVLERQAIGKFGEKQIIAANIDFGVIVQSVNRDFNINRLERYLTLCHTAKIKPIIVITKVDLVPQEIWMELFEKIKSRVDQVPVVFLSNTTGEGVESLKKLILKGKTYCLLGSSGVGKSSLINSLSGEGLMKTGVISLRIDRGKHVTTHRELVPLVNGAILIDNPGMREVGITERAEGLENTFEKIYELANDCKYADCTHTSEKGCAVLSALEIGMLEKGILDNFYKMEREQAYFSSTVQERRNKDKHIGKIHREVKSLRKREKF